MLVDVKSEQQADSELDRPQSKHIAFKTANTEFKWQESVSSSLCGVFSACSAMQRLGSNVSAKDFISAKYVGTCEKGATQYQVAAIIEDSGYSACYLDKLSIFDLKLIDLPFYSFCAR